MKRASKILTLVGVIVYLLLTVNTHALKEILSHISIWILPMSITIEWAFFCVESLRIRSLFRDRFSYWLVLRSRLISVLIGNFLPGMTLAEIARVFVIERFQPGNKILSTTVFLTNRIYGLLAIILVLSISIVRRHELAGSFGIGVSVAAVIPIIVFLPLALNLRRFRFFVLTAVRLTTGKTRKLFLQIYRTLVFMCSFRVWASTLLSSVITCFLAAIQIWLCGVAVGIDLQFEVWVFIMTLTSVAVFLPFGLGAIGTQDLSLVMLAKVFGQSPEAFLAVSLLIHLTRVIGSLPGLIFIGDLRGWKLFQKTDK